MAKIERLTNYTAVKQTTNKDFRSMGTIVSDREDQTSTPAQTLITMTRFQATPETKLGILIYIDGYGPLIENEDFTWGSMTSGGTYDINLALSIPTGLNITILKMGVLMQP